jgi:hypothetical protein
MSRDARPPALRISDKEYRFRVALLRLGRVLPLQFGRPLTERDLWLCTIVAVVAIIVPSAASAIVRSESPLSFLDGIGQYALHHVDLLGVFALLVALLHSVHLTQVASGISTSPTGSFPGHLLAIRDLIVRSRFCLDIVTDALDYGSFFDPLSYGTVFKALMASMTERNVRVRFLVAHDLCSVSRSSPFASQRFLVNCASRVFTRYVHAYLNALALDERFVKAINDCDATTTHGVRICAGVRAKMTALRYEPEAFDIDATRVVCLAALNHHDALFNAAERTGDEAFTMLLLLRLLWYEDRIMAAGAEQLMIEMTSSVGLQVPFFWVADKERDGVFLFPVPADEETGARGFVTRDVSLLRTFDRMFATAWSSASQDGTGPLSSG